MTGYDEPESVARLGCEGRAMRGRVLTFRPAARIAMRPGSAPRRIDNRGGSGKGGSDAVYYGRKLRGATNEADNDSELRAPSAAMAGYELLNERASQRTRVPGTLDRWLGQRFSG